MIRQRLYQIFIKPRQVMLLDAQSGKPARSLRLRPISFILVFLLTAGSFTLLGMQFNRSNGNRSLLPQHLQLQRQHEQLLEQLAEANANNELKDQQLETLQQEMATQQEMASEPSQRLRMLESILEARKATGIQLLEASASWVGNDSIRYGFTLVKGGSYPRRVSGSIALIAQGPEGEKVTLQLEKQLTQLPFRIETHTFLRGLAQWDYDWFPEKLQATVFNHKGKELLQMELSIQGAPK
ncbi:hypothetical protein ACFL3K_01040 [Pseudomonadota bacterium]